MVAPAFNRQLSYRFRNVKLAAEAKRQRETLVAVAAGLAKAASLGGDQEQSFEQAFASLAYTHIRDKAPRLLDFLIGFQLVDRNEDSTKAVGIFGFKIGEQWAYAPVMFMNGDMKGHELLYLKGKDQFVPLKENWINYILAQRPHILGEGDSRSAQQLGVRQPDLTRLSTPPFGKFSEELPKHFRDWSLDFLPVYGSLTVDDPWKLAKYAGLDDRLSLPCVLAQDIEFCKLAYAAYKKYPAVKHMLDTHYGPDLIKTALETLLNAVDNKSAADDSVFGDLPDSDELEGIFGQKSAETKLRILTYDSSTLDYCPQWLNDADRERIVRNGYIVQDKRAADEVSTAYETTSPIQLTNPDKTGLYDVLMQPGVFKRCFVASQPMAAGGHKPLSVVVQLDPRDWKNTHRNNIFVRTGEAAKDDDKDFGKWYEGLSSAELTAGYDHRYIVVTKNGDATCPFRIDDKPNGNTCVVDWQDYGEPQPSWTPKSMDSSYPVGECSYGRKHVIFNEHRGSSFRVLGDTLYVPEDSKVLRISKSGADHEPGTSMSGPYGSSWESKNAPFILSGLPDIELKLQYKSGFELGSSTLIKDAAKSLFPMLRVSVLGSEAVINDSVRKTKKATLFDLIWRHGLREKAARALMAKAEKAAIHGLSATVFIKYAQDPGMVAPSFPAPVYDVSQASNYAPSIMPQQELLPVDAFSAGNTDPSVYDQSPEALPDPYAMQSAMQAAQTGQKEVMDTSMISGLVKAVHKDSLVKKFIPDLLKALDRLGRILFMFYWHNEEFMDQYGKADLPELEDTLRNSFESLGDTTLYLQEKDASPLLGSSMTAPSLEDVASI